MHLSVVALCCAFHIMAQSNIKLEKLKDSRSEMCASSEHHLTVKVRSLLECGVQCAKHRLRSCTAMTYTKANKTCRLLTMNLSLSYVPGCTSYQAKRSKDVVSITPVKNITVDSQVSPTPVINNWIIIQQRINRNVSFNQSWETYKYGFGNLSSNFWFGLENLQPLMAYPLALRLEILANGIWYSDMYSTFNLKNEAQGYRIHVDGYFGDNGDVFKNAPSQDLVIFNSQFSTFDRDNDNLQTGSCASDSGWWFRKCCSFNLNAPYGDPSQFRYYLVKSNSYVPITTCRMMVKLA